MLRLLVSIVASVALVPRVATTQTPTPVEPGHRVRVAHRCKVTREHVVHECRSGGPPRVDSGQLQALDGEILRLRAPSSGAELVIPTSYVSQLWVADGKKGNFWRGAAIGLFAGALAGGAIGSTQELCIFKCLNTTAVGAMVGAPVGFLFGGVIGQQIESDRWRSTNVTDLRLGMRTRAGGIGLQVSWVF